MTELGRAWRLTHVRGYLENAREALIDAQQILVEVKENDLAATVVQACMDVNKLLGAVRVLINPDRPGSIVPKRKEHVWKTKK